MSTTVIRNVISAPGAFSGHIDIASNRGKVGKLYIEDSGEQENTRGTLLCVPGIGDIRTSYRFVAEAFISKGYRVIVSDIRGMGDSNSGFDEFSPETVALDMKEIIKQRGLTKNVFLVGNSLAAGSAILAASENIPSVKGIVMLGPIIRDMPADRYFRPLSHVLFAGFWGKSMWYTYYSSLYKRDNKPDGYQDHLDQMKTCFRKGNAMSSLGRFLRASKQNVDDHVSKINVPVLAVYGDQDPDYPDVPKEKEWLLKTTKNNKQVEATILKQVGHYPHVEAFGETRDIVNSFLEKQLLQKA